MTRKERLIDIAIRWEKIENEFFEKKKERGLVFLEIRNELGITDLNNISSNITNSPILRLLCTEIGREVLSKK